MGMAAVLRACREMAEAEAREDWMEAEIVGTPREYWLGDRRVSAETVNIGLTMLLFRSEGIGTDYEIHTLNSHGRDYARTGVLPLYEDAVKRALSENKPSRA